MADLVIVSKEADEGMIRAALHAGYRFVGASLDEAIQLTDAKLADPKQIPMSRIQFAAALAASPSSVNVEEIVRVLGSLVSEIEDRIDACDEQIAGLRGKDGEWPRMHEIDMEKMWLWALLDRIPVRALLSKLKSPSQKETE